MLYSSLIEPHVNYCIMTLGFESNSIIKLQKNLRVITLSNYISHTEPLYEKVNLLILKVYYKLKLN